MTVEDRLARVLTIGSAASTALLAIGLVTSLTMRAPVADLWMRAGLLILFGTPIARVVVALAGFARSREWRFVLMTAIVLGILLSSVFAALSR